MKKIMFAVMLVALFSFMSCASPMGPSLERNIEPEIELKSALDAYIDAYIEGNVIQELENRVDNAILAYIEIYSIEEFISFLEDYIKNYIKDDIDIYTIFNIEPATIDSVTFYVNDTTTYEGYKPNDVLVFTAIATMSDGTEELLDVVVTGDTVGFGTRILTAGGFSKNVYINNLVGSVWVNSAGTPGENTLSFTNETYNFVGVGSNSGNYTISGKKINFKNGQYDNNIGLLENKNMIISGVVTFNPK